MRPVKVGVVGVGALGRHHARILGQMDGVELVGVADTNAQHAAAIAEQCATRALTDYRELLGRIEAVSIAVPTSSHLQVGSAFLEAGIPVLIEKPLAGTLAEAEELASRAATNETLLQVGHIERFNPAMQAAQRHVGTPKYIRCERVSPFAFRSTDIGVVHDLMIHDIDLVLALVDSPVRSVEAFGISIMGGQEDAVQARVRHESGCVADFVASRINPGASRTMQVWSASGCVKIDFTSREVVSIAPSEMLLFGISPLARSQQPGADIEDLKRQVFDSYLKVHQPQVSHDDALTAELSSFVECVQTGTRPLVGPEEAVAAMAVADRILEAVEAHEWDGHAGGAIGPHPNPQPARRLAG